MIVKGAFPIRWAAQDGKDGMGVSIVSNIIRYAVGTSGTVKPSGGWQEAIPSVNNGSYLWTWTHIGYSDGTSSDLYSVSRMGADGRGIQSSSVTYSQRATNVDPATITDWGQFPSSLTDGYWLYTRTHVVYTSGSSTDSYSVSQIGTGSYYAGTQEYYAVHDNSSTAPEGYPDAGTYPPDDPPVVTEGWSEEMPQTDENNKYIWNFEISFDSRGNRYVTEPVCIGHIARNIVSVAEDYAISKYSSATGSRKYPSDISTWKGTAPSPTNEKPYLWNRTITTYDDESISVYYHVCMVKGLDGSPGDAGIAGCVLRITEWAEGIEYHNDESLTSGTRYIDIAIRMGATVNTYEAFKCRETHNSSDHPLAVGTYWEKVNDLAPVMTPLIIAQYGMIRFSQTNQLLVMKEDGQTVVAGMGGGDYPIWAGDANPENAPFSVSYEGILKAIGAELVGKVTSGIENGQRVEIDPGTRSINIFDMSGELVSTFEGNSYSDISNLFDDTGGSVILNENKDNIQRAIPSTDDPITNSGELPLNAPLYTSTPTEISISGSMYVEVNIPNVPSVSNIASSNLTLRVKTYSDERKENLLSNTLVAILGVALRDSSDDVARWNRDLHNMKVKVNAGYHVLVMEYYVTASNSGCSAIASWGVNAPNMITFSATYNSDFYVSRYFANGLCFGVNAHNYIFLRKKDNGNMALTCDMNGHGFQVDETGVKTKMPGGNFCSMPIVLLRCYVTTINGTAEIYNQSSFDGSTFDNSQPVSETNGNATRTSTGNVVITFPTSWKYKNIGFSIAKCFVTITGVSDSIRTNLTKGTLQLLNNSKLEFIMSDDASVNDGTVILKLEYFV